MISEIITLNKDLVITELETNKMYYVGRCVATLDNNKKSLTLNIIVEDQESYNNNAYEFNTQIQEFINYLKTQLQTYNYPFSL